MLLDDYLLHDYTILLFPLGTLCNVIFQLLSLPCNDDQCETTCDEMTPSQSIFRKFGGFWASYSRDRNADGVVMKTSRKKNGTNNAP